jgi:hypothetical protein
MTRPNSFLDALASPQRSPELADADDPFGWLIGSWEVVAVLHDPSGNIEKRRGEVYASWELEGRAIQDLFIFPRQIDRFSAGPSMTTRTPRQSERTIALAESGESTLSIRQPTKPVRNWWRDAFGIRS